MPVYSISRTTQYTTVTALETKTNQDGFSWNGFDAEGYASNFVVNLLTDCCRNCNQINELSICLLNVISIIFCLIG